MRARIFGNIVKKKWDRGRKLSRLQNIIEYYTLYNIILIIWLFNVVEHTILCTVKYDTDTLS